MESTGWFPATASTKMDSVVNGFVQFIVARQSEMCKMEELEKKLNGEKRRHKLDQNVTRGP